MRRAIRIIFTIILLLGLIAGGFALGIYLRIFDMQALNEEYRLHEIPYVGEYFVPPLNEEDEVASEGESAEKNMANEDRVAEKEPAKETMKENTQPAIKITAEDIARQKAEREAAEKKRVTKLARLYNEMKASDAAEAMKNLNIDLCIAILNRMDEGNAAKILAAFEAGKAAEITQIMYEGEGRRNNSGE